MENNNYINIVAGLFGLIALTSAGAAWSSEPLPAENKLDPTYYEGVDQEPMINFTDINLFYVRNRSSYQTGRIHRRWHRSRNPAGLGSTGNFVARSGHESTFTLNNIPGYDGITFGGYFSLTADISQDGTFQEGSFSFISTDELFDFGTETVCRWRGHRCRDKDIFGEVFSGTLTDFGWSENESFIEFETSDLTGWVCDMGWCSADGAHERLWFNVDGDLGFTGDSNAWSAQADGAAVIPVPAAVWLFGSGLITLLGFSRKRKVG